MRRLAYILLPVLVLAARAPLAGQARPFLLGPITAQPGEKASGYLDVPAGVDSGTRIPVTVIQGRAAGPVLALIGAAIIVVSVFLVVRIEAGLRANVKRERHRSGQIGAAAALERDG